MEEKMEQQEHTDHEEIVTVHYHAVLTSNGIAAKLPAVPTKELAISSIVKWMPARISPLGVADLMNHGCTDRTGLGTVALMDCYCDDELLTSGQIAELMKME